MTVFQAILEKSKLTTLLLSTATKGQTLMPLVVK